MLIRVRGGESGIKEYLETGRKDGRDFGRAELDERVILAGDLEQIDQVLGVMNKSGEQYMHVTLSFREDDIPEGTLREIADEFRRFAMAAYREDEYAFYAEAHLPRIKGYTDQRTGDDVERKPHIHIVIPNWNLLSEKQMQPLGRVENQTNVIDAFQEQINARFGLASPKDHRRVAFTDESVMIARYKGDLFKGAGHDVKEKALGLILERDVRNVEQLAGVLGELGQVKERNAGRDGAYLNLKPEGAARGVNLKDYVFTPEFLALPAADKRAKLQGDVARGYEEAGRQRPTPEKIAALLTDWREKRADEIKYLNSGHKAYKAYREAPPAEQTRILGDLRGRFYERYDTKEPTHDRGHLAAVAENLRAADGNLRSAARHLDAIERAPRGFDQAERNVADRRARRAIGAAVARLVGDQAEVGDRAELAGAGERSVSPTDSREGRPIDSEIGQKAAQARRQPVRGRDIDRIKATLDAGKLLEYVARSHGVKVEKYAVAKDSSGADRIVCGRRHLNVSDFLTQEMRLPWKEAATLLRRVDGAERGEQARQQAAASRKALWERFSREYRPAQRRLRSEAWAKQKKDEKTRRDDARQRYQAKRREIQNDRSMKGPARRAALSIARMEKVTADKTLRDEIARERDTMRAAWRLKPQDEFRDYLADRANRGDAEALTELRRQRLPAAPSHSDGMRAADQSAAAANAFVPPNALPSAVPIRYEVNGRGHVTYIDADKSKLFTDTGRAVDFTRRDRQARELGLRLAVEKFGPKLALYGSDEYKAEMAKIAAEAGLRVTFADPKVHAVYTAELAARQPAERPAPTSSPEKPERKPEIPTKEQEQSPLQRYIEERKDYKKRIPSAADDYTQYEGKDAGEFAYEGWRSLKDGSKAVLLRRGSMIHVMPASEALAKDMSALPRGRIIQVDAQGRVQAKQPDQSKDRGKER